jgi:hypothetical protein
MQMHDLDVRPRFHPLHATGHAELADLGAHIQHRWPSLPTPLIGQWSETPVVALERSGTPWIYGPIERDPLQGARGRTVLPRRQRSQLKQIAKLGIPFQRLAIAHELDRDGPVKQALPALRQGPHTCTDEVARRLVGDIPTHPGVARGIKVLDAAVRTSAAPVNALTAVLDPIIFGVIAAKTPHHGQPCLWYPLVAWRW